MARINLLPWRQAERERKNREFLTIVGAVLLLSLLAAFATWSYFNDTLDSQKQANDKIKTENTKLDAALAQIDSLEKQRNDMLAQMKVIQDLQGRRPIPVRVWDDIARLIPAQLYLTNMKREGDVITFTGRADNPNVVSDFIRNLDSSQWLENSAVRSINQPQAVAYQPPKQVATIPNAPVGHPEDNYVIFVVTTSISQATTPDSTTASTSASATSTTALTLPTSVGAATSAPQTTTNASAGTSTNPKLTSASSSISSSPIISSSNSTTSSTTTTNNSISNDALKPVTNASSVRASGSNVAQSIASTANKEKQ